MALPVRSGDGRSGDIVSASAMTPGFPAGDLPDQPASPGYRGSLIFGIVVLVLFFGVFGAWAATAPLDSAAIAQGQLYVSGNRKQVQHLEGGIVRQLFVQEGSTVQAGDPIIELDPTQADASLGLLQSRLAYASAREARLIAERAGRSVIAFPDWLARERSNPVIAPILQAEEAALRAARDVMSDQSGIWLSRARQLEEEITGLRNEIQSSDDQLALISQEIADQQFLTEKGLGIRRVLLNLQRQATEIRGRRARSEAGIARNRQAIGESRLRIAELQKARTTEIDNELGQLTSEIAGLQERIGAARDVQQRMVIRAPIAGKVVNLQTHTIGGIVRAGEQLMELVPLDSQLIVIARISPADIDVVHAGMKAQIRLSAYPGRTAPVVDGIVEIVSADLLTDERTGAPYYEARVKLPPNDPQLAQVELYPGMPAEVSIVGGEQTLLTTLIRPLTDTMRRGATQN